MTTKKKTTKAKSNEISNCPPIHIENPEVWDRWQVIQRIADGNRKLAESQASLAHAITADTLQVTIKDCNFTGNGLRVNTGNNK